MPAPPGFDRQLCPVSGGSAHQKRAELAITRNWRRAGPSSGHWRGLAIIEALVFVEARARFGEQAKHPGDLGPLGGQKFKQLMTGGSVDEEHGGTRPARVRARDTFTPLPLASR
jgi:hypothetical protein